MDIPAKSSQEVEELIGAVHPGPRASLAFAGVRGRHVLAGKLLDQLGMLAQ
jgi:hypothetical protein